MGKALSVLAAIIILAVIGLAAYLLLTTSLLSSLLNQPAPSQNNVLVSGVIRTSFTTSPVGINFTSQKTGQAAYTTINKAGHYSVALLGNDTYNVTIYYSSLFGVSTSKGCRGVLYLNGTATSANFSRSC